MTFSEWFDFARDMWRKQEGQTMAEYGVVLAVITIGAVGVFTAAVWRDHEFHQQGDRPAPVRRAVMREGKRKMMLSYSDVADLFRAIRRREEGQTMAEYGVTLAVICVATVAVFTALSGGITGTINKVVGLLP